MEEVKLLFHGEVGMILDSAMEVHRVLGHGLLEKPYENALVREFQLRDIPFVQQPRFPIDYKGRCIGEFVPDLIAFDCIVVDTKTIDHIGDLEIAKCSTTYASQSCESALSSISNTTVLRPAASFSEFRVSW